MMINEEQSKKKKVQTPYGCISHNDEYADKVVKEVSERLEKIKALPDKKIIEWIIQTCETLWLPREYYNCGSKIMCKDYSSQNYYIANYIKRFTNDNNDAVEDLLFCLRSWEDSI